jgi:hypothetical protein
MLSAFDTLQPAGLNRPRTHTEQIESRVVRTKMNDVQIAFCGTAADATGQIVIGAVAEAGPALERTLPAHDVAPCMRAPSRNDDPLWISSPCSILFGIRKRIERRAADFSDLRIRTPAYKQGQFSVEQNFHPVAGFQTGDGDRLTDSYDNRTVNLRGSNAGCRRSHAQQTTPPAN